MNVWPYNVFLYDTLIAPEGELANLPRTSLIKCVYPLYIYIYIYIYIYYISGVLEKWRVSKPI